MMDSLDGGDSTATDKSGAGQETSDNSQVNEWAIFDSQPSDQPVNDQAETGYQSAQLPENTGDFKSKVREGVIRPIVEGIQNPKEAARGFVKAAGRTLMGASRLGQSIFEKTIGQVPRVWGGDALGRDEQELEMEMKIMQALQSETPAQKLGGAIEGVAEAVIPGTLASKSVSGVAKARGIGKAATAGLEIGTQGAVAGAQEAIAQGEINSEAAKAALIAAGTTGAFEGLGPVWKAMKGAPIKDELAANILGPTKGMAKQFDDATEGIVAVAESFPGGQRKIASELSKAPGREAYTKLSDRATQMQDGIWADLQQKLGGIKETYRTTEAGEAISIAKETLANQPGQAARSVLMELENLGAKNVKDGLTPLEMNRVKILFSKAENMYNALGAEVKGMSAESLRDVRNSLKTRIEKEAAKSGVTDVAELNAKYGQLAAAKNMLENRALDYVTFSGRQMRENVLQKATRAIMELPVVNQSITQPLQTVAQMIGRGIRSDKVNVLEVEKQIPQMLNELKKLGLKQKDFSVVESAIKSAIRSAAIEQEKQYQERKMGISPNA